MHIVCKNWIFDAYGSEVNIYVKVEYNLATKQREGVNWIFKKPFANQ